jgi:hypothetical protein
MFDIDPPNSPEEVQIRKTLPAIAERHSLLHQSLTHDVNEWGVQTKERLDNIETRLRDLFKGRVSMTLNSTRCVAAPGCSTPCLDDDGNVVSLHTDLSAKLGLAVPVSNRRRRRRTCSPARSRPSRSCGGSGQWVWETARPCKDWKICTGLAGVKPTANR